MAIYIFCGLLILIAMVALIKNTLSNKKDKRLDILSSLLLLISSILLLIYGIFIN
ncbi:hypothetical protein [Staphylococcus chromogenes]|uniref:hypothetical protein n=1 Tax=Staphylococcus chromogenes TaxID=46126 RepID=UPI002DBB6D9D|nr:hypothetical protein [Staphylococcus chromogenes]MEB7825613.1 hypothetical protein [Staphylococcus chromogenes]